MLIYKFNRNNTLPGSSYLKHIKIRKGKERKTTQRYYQQPASWFSIGEQFLVLCKYTQIK